MIAKNDNMNTNIRIIGNSLDEDVMSQAAVAFEISGCETDICTSFNDVSDNISSQSICNLLWLSLNSTHDLYTIAETLKSRGEICINFFSEPLTLTNDQKNVIGKNTTFFQALNPDNWVEDFMVFFSSCDVKLLAQTNMELEANRVEQIEAQVPDMLVETRDAHIQPNTNISPQKTAVDSPENTKGDSKDLSPGGAIILAIIVLVAWIYLVGNSTWEVIVGDVLVFGGVYQIMSGVKRWKAINGATWMSRIAIILCWVIIILLAWYSVVFFID